MLVCRFHGDWCSVIIFICVGAVSSSSVPMKQSSHVDLVFKLLGSAWCVNLWNPTHTNSMTQMWTSSQVSPIPLNKCFDFHKIRKYQLTPTLSFLIIFSSWPSYFFKTEQFQKHIIHSLNINPDFLSHFDFFQVSGTPWCVPTMCPTGPHRYGDLWSSYVVAQLVLTFSFLGSLSEWWWWNDGWKTWGDDGWRFSKSCGWVIGFLRKGGDSPNLP